jgi:hypothetical protein
VALTTALALTAGAMVWTVQAGGAPPPKDIELTPIGGYTSGLYDQGAVEISAYDPGTQRVFMTFAEQNYIGIVSLADPASPVSVGQINLAPWGPDAHATSVDFRNGILAAAVPQGEDETGNGRALFFNADGDLLADVTVGALPDMVTFTPNGEMVLTANEGQPNDAYDIDPEGSVSIIDMTVGVTNLTDLHVTAVGFAAFNGATLDPSIRIFGPGASVAQDLEPEYIAVSHDSRTAWVTLQENNAIAIIDLRSATVTDLVGLGFKDHSVAGNGLDGNNADDQAVVATWPIFGVYMPDGIASFTIANQTFLVTANEGDAREYDGLDAPFGGGDEEPVNIENLPLDPVAFPNAAALQDDEDGIGNLKATPFMGDIDGDDLFEELYVFGGRSFSIWTAEGQLVYDSGDDLEVLTADVYPDYFNASNTNNSVDNRSDDKGPEPEGVTHAKLFGRDFLFVMLERIGGVAVYEVSNPMAPRFVQYINWRDLSIDPDDDPAAAGDLGPEAARVIQAEDSPNGQPLLIVSNEVSGTLRVFQISQKK